MKRRDFLKGILSTPVAAVALSKASTDLSVLSPKPSEVEDSEDMKKVRAEEEIEEEEYIVSPSVTFSCSPSASLSASCESSSVLCDPTSEYFKAHKVQGEQMQRAMDDIIIDVLKGKK